MLSAQELPQGAAVAAPPTPATPAPTPIVIQRPLTSRDVAALRERRSELSHQLSSAEGRRESLVQELRTTDAATRTGIVARIELLDRRILQIETDIAENGQQLALAPLAMTQPARGSFPFAPPRGSAIGGGVILFITFMTLAIVRRLRSARFRNISARADAESSSRLQAIEQAVDAIAIEVERIGEAQRYQGRLLGDGAGQDVPAFGAERREAERVPSSRPRG